MESSINIIIETMEKYYAKYKQLVPVEKPSFDNDGLSIEPKFINILEENPCIFYKCTARRYALVKWIFNIIEKMFEDADMKPVLVEDIYSKLQKEFNTISMNRNQLNNLLKHRVLDFEDFHELNNKTLSNNQPEFKKNLFLNNHKQVINSFFDSQVISDEDFKLKFDLSFLSDEEHQIIDKLILAKQEVGAENCTEFLKDSNLLLTSYRLMSTLASKYNEYQKNRIEIYNLITSINFANYEAKIEWLVRAFSSSKSVQSEMFGILQKYKIYYVKEMNLLLRFSPDLEVGEINLIRQFSKWLLKDLKLYAYNELDSLFKDNRRKSILLKRSQGCTLEVTGKEVNLTRERVRQIEKKLRSKFNSYIIRTRSQYILLAFSDIDFIVAKELVESTFRDLTCVFIYFIQSLNLKSIVWIEELNAIIYNENSWYEFLIEKIEALPDTLSTLELEDKIKEICWSPLIKISPEFILEIAKKSYRLIGNMYSRVRMSKNRMYQIIVEKHFPDGIKVFDDFEMMRFKSCFKEEFGDIELADNRAIAMRVTDHLILCDRGKYILPEKVNVPTELLEEIISYVQESNKNTIMFHELFEVFKKELLLNSDIHNRYFLQGVLKLKYSDKFTFTRDTICKESTEIRSIRHEIEEFIKSSDGIVTKDEIRKAFPGITEMVINLHTSGNENVLLWGFGECIHISKINLENDFVEQLGDALKEYTSSGAVSARKIYEELFNLDNDLMNDHNITGHIALFSLLQYLFNEEYEFSRPYIGPKNSTSLNENALIKEYVSSFSTIRITDLKMYLDDMRIRIMNYSALLDELSEEFLRVDEDLLMRKDLLDISKETVGRIEEALVTIMGQSGYISSRILSDFFFFPNVGVKWTEFLLVSIIKSYGELVKVINMNTDYRYLNSIFVNSNLNIVDYDSLLYHAIKQEVDNKRFKNVDEVETFLLEQGLIANNIPDSLFEKGFLVNEIIIN